MNRRACLAGVIAGATVGLPVAAQQREPSFVYIVGYSRSEALVSLDRLPRESGNVPTVWMRLTVRNPHVSVPRGSGWHVRWMRLSHPYARSSVWDTIEHSRHPLLLVTRDSGGTVLNRAGGSIAGLVLSREEILDLFVVDDGRLGARTQGYVLEIDTLDGRMRLPVQPINPSDKQF